MQYLRPASVVALLAGVACAHVVVNDPGDYVDLAAAKQVNAILADYNITPTLYQTTAIVGPYYYSGKKSSTTVSHRQLSVNKNDTSVVVVTEGANISLDYVTIVKDGYGSNLFQESFFGLNAAVNVANGSTATVYNSNITVLEGAANVYSFGTGTTVYVYDTDLYSAGPVSHGLYASGNGTIIAKDIRHYSGGNRASSFSGDNPAGYLYIEDAIAHTAGIGSAIFYALGVIHATNVVGLAEQAPVLFSDSNQQIYLNNVDLTSNFLAGTVMFSSMTRASGAYLLLNESSLTVTAADQPALWYGNVIVSTDIIASQINTESNILVIANRSQVTQAFNHFAGYEENTGIAPAEVTITVSESDLTGDIVAYNGSSISWSLTDYSSWCGKGVTGKGAATLGVSLDTQSKWTLTGDTSLLNFTNADKNFNNIQSGGHSITYAKNAPANKYLGGKTYSLPGGGKLKPSN
ncbi:hypothetical protein K461DRAFT_300066 [Myriangium duriaei CBS 260.36]|uniref:Right handed beta helix domain-containing protein n=1 Tax=Myriangium duriaei CBS 260.36 TaxID=1168546 RepID=A0A9P4MMB7_9PEZI|nr:hypothetical protein K461DRAFT_300066 [Myriangium duriaei CBS 260.36]